MTNQDIFNKIWEHFVINKGAPSISPESKLCVYRGSNGEKCAVGVIIPDDKYVEDMEGKSIYSDLVGSALPEGDYSIKFVDSLQSVHDSHARLFDQELFTEEIEGSLKEVAKDYNLQIPPLTE